MKHKFLIIGRVIPKTLPKGSVACVSGLQVLGIEDAWRKARELKASFEKTTDAETTYQDVMIFKIQDVTNFYPSGSAMDE